MSLLCSAGCMGRLRDLPAKLRPADRSDPADWFDLGGERPDSGDERPDPESEDLVDGLVMSFSTLAGERCSTSRLFSPKAQGGGDGVRSLLVVDLDLFSWLTLKCCQCGGGPRRCLSHFSTFDRIRRCAYGLREGLSWMKQAGKSQHLC